jgi:rubrerythrin
VATEREHTAATRQRFLKLAFAGAGTVSLGAVLQAELPAVALGRPSPGQDAEILNYALLLEELQTAFYGEAVAGGGLDGELLEFARVVVGHEREHVRLLRGALGAKARKAPRFEFGAATTSPKQFAAAAFELEELGVAAYNGQAANLTRDALIAAARIVSVDARHAAWIRAIQDKRPASRPTDRPKTRREVLAAVDRTGFVRS